jgi:DNA-binding GntR family transcriptional regulator
LNRGLRPGERTSANLLATRLGIGRTPIKEAITRLQTEGVLSVAGRSGTTVKTLGTTEAEQIFALRRTLEEFAADEAVKNVTRSDIKRLRELLREMRAASSEPGSVEATVRFIRANVALHTTIVAAAGNPFLDRVYSQLHVHVQIVTYLAHRGYDPAAARRRQREHEGIVRALTARDANALKRLLKEHATATEGAILSATIATSSQPAGGGGMPADVENTPVRRAGSPSNSRSTAGKPLAIAR